MPSKELTPASSTTSPDIAPPDGNTGKVSVSQLDFINEIRYERLNLLWKITLVAVVILAWVIFLFAESIGGQVITLIAPIVLIGIASFSTRHFLRIRRYEVATWVYALGMIITVSVMMIPDDRQTRELVPFTAVVVVFIIGLLMSVPNTFLLLGLGYVSLLIIPFVGTGGDFLPVEMANLFAYLLMFVAAGLVVLVSGELYSIAEWALDSYRKERKTADKLNESRLEVEKSLLKQRGLTEQLREINLELDEARKAAEVAKSFRGQFLANMSHELRTPLNAVIGFSETMLNFPLMYSGVELPDEYRKDLGQIYTSGKHLLSIINDILDLSKIDAGRLELEIQAVDLEPIFKGLLSTSVGLIGGKPIELKRLTPAVLPRVKGDPLRVRQVLLNLLSNAAKFTDEGYIALHLHENGDRVVIGIEDTGPGISLEDRQRIFEAFQQGASGRKQQRAGSGLGLAICQQLLTLMDGEIWVESEVGKGSIFYVGLPRYEEGLHAETEWRQVDPMEEVIGG